MFSKAAAKELQCLDELFNISRADLHDIIVLERSDQCRSFISFEISALTHLLIHDLFEFFDAFRGNIVLATGHTPDRDEIFTVEFFFLERNHSVHVHIVVHKLFFSDIDLVFTFVVNSFFELLEHHFRGFLVEFDALMLRRIEFLQQRLDF